MKSPPWNVRERAGGLSDPTGLGAGTVIDGACDGSAPRPWTIRRPILVLKLSSAGRFECEEFPGRVGGFPLRPPSALEVNGPDPSEPDEMAVLGKTRGLRGDGRSRYRVLEPAMGGGTAATSQIRRQSRGVVRS